MRIFALVAVAGVVAALLALWAFTTFVFPTEFTPITLNQKERQTLDRKLDRIDQFGVASGRSTESLRPEPYSEEGADREIVLSERELNALLASNTDLARRLVIDLSDNLASGKLLIPLDDEFPLLGGKTVKVTAGLELAYADGRPRVVLRGVSIWGVPLPNAWLGNLKHVDLVKEFGDAGGFWSTLAAGIDDIRVEEGRLRLRLKE